jgi:predicted neutral ceramidase superfamily lipid hydrolase
LATLRLIPIVLCAIIAWWALDRLGQRSIEPVALLSLLALSLALRLAFEVSLYGYYLMSISVLLLLVEIARGRIRVLYVVWTAVATWATVGGGLVDHSTFAGVDVQVWQLLIVAIALYLGASPLLAIARYESPIETSTLSN